MQEQVKARFIEIEANFDGQRIDNYLLAHLKGLPKSYIYRIIRKGEVRVNKGRIKAEYKLNEGDIVRIPPMRLSSREALPSASDELVTLLKKAVLFEDQDLLVINKLAGMSVHPGTGVRLSLIDALRQIYSSKHLELVHRLDKGTSGCLLVAKNRHCLKTLQDQFRKHQVQKEYHALVSGDWPDKLQAVDLALERQTPRSGERFVKADEQGKAATTHFSVLERLDGHTLLKAMPKTGRTHQIRVHAQQAGYPIVGDEKYSQEKLKWYKKVGIQRLCLHAASIRFSHITGDSIKVKAPLDEKFVEAVCLFRR